MNNSSHGIAPRWSWWAAMAFGGMALVVFAIAVATRDPWTAGTVAAVAVLFAAFQRKGSDSSAAATVLLAGSVVMVSLAFARRIAGTLLWNIRHIPEWDFLAFWVHAKSAAHRLDFYDPHSAQRWATTLDVTADFHREILDVGFWYPPPSMFLFLPLGWLGQRPALVFWYALHVLLLAVVVLLLVKLFFRRLTWSTVGMCGALVAATPATLSTVAFAQTNFAVLLAVLLFWRSRRAARGGVALALGIFVKPLLALALLPAVLGRRWRAVSGFVIAAAALLAASAGAFGLVAFIHYFRPTGEKPDWIYTEDSNQSALGFILRATGSQCHAGGCLTNPGFVVVTSALFALTAWLSVWFARRMEDGEEWSLALILPCALLIYPATQFHYSLLLLPPLLLLFREREQLPGGAKSTAALVAVVFGLCSLHHGNWTVLGCGLTWLAVAGAGVWRGRGGRSPTPTKAQSAS